MRNLARAGETTGFEGLELPDIAHRCAMPPVPSEPLPGSMTVPPWFGWEAILVVLVLLVVLAVAFFVASAAGPDVDGRSEWQAGLDARSRWRREAGAGPGELDRPDAEPAAGDAPGAQPPPTVSARLIP